MRIVKMGRNKNRNIVLMEIKM